MSRAAVGIFAVLLALFGLFSLYSAAFWAWVTATPLTPAQLERARYNHYCWLVIGILSVIVAAASALFAWRRGRREPRT